MSNDDHAESTKCDLEVKTSKKPKEKSRTVRKYFGSLTSTRYLHSMFSPIIKETATDLKKLRRTASGKSTTLVPSCNNDVCAIVVPSESTTQIPVIKRRSFVKECNTNNLNKQENNRHEQLLDDEDIRAKDSKIVL
uniref:Uncharacterized protein n=1 Tax=Syphacia muris TaxID=451379 RepID=A0A0N5AGF0_9BILA